jgi:hypothetical protein
MARRTHRLSLDRLESRELMAGDITAFVGSNTLYLGEVVAQSGQPNAVQITQLANGAIRVAGQVNSGGTLTHVKGAAYQDFFLPNGSVVVSFGAGNDRVRVTNAKFNIVNIDLSYPNTNDVDTIDINGLTTTGAVQLRSGGGVDNVFVQNAKIGDGTGFEDLNINSGAGADFVRVGSLTNGFVEVRGNLILNTFTSLAETDADIVDVYQTTVYKSVFLDTGAGNDRLDVVSVVAGDDIVTVLGDGNDKATMREVRAVDQFFVAMGTGNDTLDMTYLRANYLSVDGGPGFDSLSKSIDGPTGSSSFTGWEVINGRRIWNLSGLLAPISGVLAMP